MSAMLAPDSSSQHAKTPLKGCEEYRVACPVEVSMSCKSLLSAWSVRGIFSLSQNMVVLRLSLSWSGNRSSSSSNEVAALISFEGQQLKYTGLVPQTMPNGSAFDEQGLITDQLEPSVIDLNWSPLGSDSSL